MDTRTIGYTANADGSITVTTTIIQSYDIPANQVVAVQTAQQDQLNNLQINISEFSTIANIAAINLTTLETTQASPNTSTP